MFASLLRTRKGKHDAGETTPLLQALSRYRSRDVDARSAADDDDDDNDAAAPYDAGDEDYEDEDDAQRRRDGPLLPVFSSEVLGMPPARSRSIA